jgi:hypothetical protein
MIADSIRLGLLSVATGLALAAEPSPLPPSGPPQALPVEPLPALPLDEPPLALPVDEPPLSVVPGGNREQPAAETRAISRSGMFRVSGGGQAQRSSVALMLEQRKEDFEALLRDRDTDAEKRAAKRAGFFENTGGGVDPFKVPVDITIAAGPGKRPVDYGLVYTADAFVLGIRIDPERGIDHDLLERAALTVLLYERSLRDVKPGEFTDPLVVRPWLVEGLAEAAKWRTGRADRRIYEGVFKRGGGFTMDELFELPERSFNQLDGASRLAFRALSGALVMALLEQPGGRGSFRAFCGEAARFSGEMPVLLRKHFPDLNLSERSLAKWWALTLAKLVQPQLSEVLPIRETELALVEALQFHSRDEDGNAVNRGIEEWQTIAALDAGERGEAVRPAEHALIRLSYRRFPSYHPLIEEYQRILRDLVNGETDEIAERLAGLAEQRQIRVERALQARDYMDYFEISRARSLSGEFDDYMRLKKELELRPRPPRRDRLSDLLDTMQKVYESRQRR